MNFTADRKAVVSKGSVRCCGSSLFLKNKFGIGYHLTLVLEGELFLLTKPFFSNHCFLPGTSKEQAIARLVTTHVAKAEKARRHGRELSFILPLNDVDHFASLFSAIEQEINNKSSKLGKSVNNHFITTCVIYLYRDIQLRSFNDNPRRSLPAFRKSRRRNR